MSNFIKIHPVGVELFHADGQTDMTKLKSLFAVLRTRLKRVSAWGGNEVADPGREGDVRKGKNSDVRYPRGKTTFAAGLVNRCETEKDLTKM